MQSIYNKGEAQAFREYLVETGTAAKAFVGVEIDRFGVGVAAPCWLIDREHLEVIGQNGHLMNSLLFLDELTVHGRVATAIDLKQGLIIPIGHLQGVTQSEAVVNKYYCVSDDGQYFTIRHNQELNG